MKNSTYQIQIKEPCQEDWSGMTNSEIGKFCSKCAKNVVNFEGFSDRQLINYLKDSTNSICGRIESTKLNKDLVLTKETKLPRKAAVAASILLLSSCVGYTQGQPIILEDRQETMEISNSQNELPLISNILRGSVVNAFNNKPLSNVTISVENTNFKTKSDGSGKFELILKDYLSFDDYITVVIDRVGFVQEQYLIEKNEFPVNELVKIELIPIVGSAETIKIKKDTIQPIQKNELYQKIESVPNNPKSNKPIENPIKETKVVEYNMEEYGILMGDICINHNPEFIDVKEENPVNKESETNHLLNKNQSTLKTSQSKNANKKPKQPKREQYLKGEMIIHEKRE